MKTFPIHFTDTEHEELKTLCFMQKKTMKDYIMEAIREKKEREQKNV